MVVASTGFSKSLVAVAAAAVVVVAAAATLGYMAAAAALGYMAAAAALETGCPIVVYHSIYGFWLFLWYLLVIVLFFIRFTASDYSFSIL